MKDTIWRNANIKSETIVRIYKTTIRRIMIPCTERRLETDKTRSLLEGIEMNVFKRGIQRRPCWTEKEVTLRICQTNRNIEEDYANQKYQ